MQIEEIVISELPSESTEEQSSKMQELDATLKQTSRFRFGEYSFKLFDHHFLSIKMDRGFRRTREYQLHIGMLDPEPIRSLRISWKNLAMFTVLAGALGMAGFTNLFSASKASILILVACAGVFLVLAMYFSHDRLVFYSQNGRLPLVTLFNRNPDRETFGAFISTLSDQILKASANLNFILGNERLNVELREHRRLMEAGIITSKAYNSSRSLILDKHR